MTTRAAKSTLAKTLAYRVVSLANTAAIGYWMTGSLKAAASLGLANLVINSALYFGFEHVWSAASAKFAAA